MKYTEAKLKKAAASRYMNQDQLDFFKEKLINMKIDLRKNLENERAELSQQSRECDDLDRAQIEEEIHLRLRILDRESKLLPKIDLALSGNALGWQEQAALESFELAGEVTPAPQLKADIRLNAKNGTFDTFKLNDLNLTFRGTEDDHKLLLDLNADPVSADLALTGKLDRSTGWQGLLNQAQIETPVGP